MKENQWNDDDVHDEYIALVLAACESAFFHIHINSPEKKWTQFNPKYFLEKNKSITLLAEIAIAQKSPVEIFNLQEDTRFSHQEITINNEAIKHFIALPLLTDTTSVIGTICIMDTKAKHLTAHQKLIIKLLARDIVLQVELVEKNQQLLNLTQLRQSLNKELAEFTYIASHDLASPLNAIKNISTWIEEDINDGINKDNPKYFQMIKSSIKRMQCLLKDLASYSRIARCDENAEHLHLQALVNECCNALTTINNIELQNFEFQVSDCEIELPKTPLMLVLTHLIANAVKHHDKKHGVIQLSCTSAADTYQLSITDDGPGIALEFHSKIFQPFQTLKPKDEIESSGLGLAIVKKVLGFYEASVTLNSQVGSGTVFIISWPKGDSIANNIAKSDKALSLIKMPCQEL